jgi:large-conductance mechanosensitive channel
MGFNYLEFLFDNGIIGTTLGTLLGFSTSRLFDTFREEILQPYLQMILEFLFSTISISNTKMISVMIEYLAILLITYLVVLFVFIPIVGKYMKEARQDEENGKRNMRKIVRSLNDIEKIL